MRAPDRARGYLEVTMPLIRFARPADAAAIAEIYAPYVATPISFELVPPSAEEIGRRIAKVMPALPWLVYERAGRVDGYAYAGPHAERAAYRWGVDAAIYVRQGAARGGLGRALYAELFDLVARQGYVQAFAGITLPNAASVGLHESFGFRPVGIYRNVGFKLGRWHDVGWWQKPLAEPLPVEPSEPVPLAALDPAWMSPDGVTVRSIGPG